MKNRFDYIKPKDDFTIHKVGYSFIFIVLIVGLFLAGTVESRIASGVFACLLIYSLVQRESYVEFLEDRIRFKNSSITKRNIVITWPSIVSIQKRLVVLPKSGFVTNFYEKSYFELVFVLNAGKRVSVQSNFGEKFEKRIRSEAQSRKIKYEENK
jgi:hypothetical protein